MKPADKPERLGDAPVTGETADSLKKFAELVNFVFNGTEDPKVGFIVMCFNFGEDDNGRCNYISNASRADVIVLLKEQLARFEGWAEPKPGRA